MKEEDVERYDSCLLKGDHHAAAYRPKDDKEDDGVGFDEDATVDNIILISANVANHRARSGERRGWI
jgi:hypothetical protein